MVSSLLQPKLLSVSYLFLVIFLRCLHFYIVLPHIHLLNFFDLWCWLHRRFNADVYSFLFLFISIFIFHCSLKFLVKSFYRSFVFVLPLCFRILRHFQGLMHFLFQFPSYCCITFVFVSLQVSQSAILTLFNHFRYAPFFSEILVSTSTLISLSVQHSLKPSAI